MDPENLTKRKNEINKIKKGLKEWEHGFFKAHKRKPTVVDIQERPKVERVYKDYQAKKKQLQLLVSEEYADSQTLSQPISFDSQQQQQQQQRRQHGHPSSQETKVFSPSSSSNTQSLSPSQKRRRGSQSSVEYIRSPSHRLSRIKYMDHLELPTTTTLDFGFTKSNNTSSEPTATSTQHSTSDADSFWLSSSQSSSTRSTQPSSGDTTSHGNSSLLDSSNTPSPFLLADNNNTKTTSKGTGNKKKRKKNAALQQKLFGHLIYKPSDTLSPALKAERESSSQPTTPTAESGPSLDSQSSPTDQSLETGENNNIEMITNDISSSSSSSAAMVATTGKMVGDLKIDGLIIAEHEQDAFRHFDSELLPSNNNNNNVDDTDDFVMPGHFTSARARSTIFTPMMEEDKQRHNRILEALRKGTLGEKRRDDDDMDGMNDDLKRFLTENTDSFADETDTTGPEEAQRTYRKKFTQKRQTRLHKFKYVETSPSNV